MYRKTAPLSLHKYRYTPPGVNRIIPPTEETAPEAQKRMLYIVYRNVPVATNVVHVIGGLAPVVRGNSSYCFR
jgi:hypothetical protein